MYSTDDFSAASHLVKPSKTPALKLLEKKWFLHIFSIRRPVVNSGYVFKPYWMCLSPCISMALQVPFDSVCWKSDSTRFTQCRQPKAQTKRQTEIWPHRSDFSSLFPHVPSYYENLHASARVDRLAGRDLKSRRPKIEEEERRKKVQTSPGGVSFFFLPLYFFLLFLFPSVPWLETRHQPFKWRE